MRAALAVLLLASTAHADEPVPEGEVIVVTGLRLPRPRKDVPAATTVVDRAQIAQSPHQVADDVVRDVPQVGTFRRSSSLIADPTSQGLNLRGVGPSGVSRALVLADGVPVNDPFGGWVYWRALSTLGIERIEIVPSGASALFGNFALGGVLQVLSRPVAGRSVEAAASVGSLGTARGAARVTERFGDFGVALDGEALHSAGYAPIVADQRGSVDGKATSDHVAAGARVEHVHGDSTAHAQLRFFDESLAAGTEHTTADVRTLTYDGGWQLAAAPGTLRVALFGGVQRFGQERARVSAARDMATLASRQRTPSNNQGAAVTWLSAPLAGHALVLGIDGQRVAGTATDTLMPPSLLAARAAGGEQRFAGAFVQDAFRAGPVELAAALRIDAWQNTGARRTLTMTDGSATTTRLADVSEVQLDPRLGALVHASEHVAVRASAYRAFRAPTLNELYRSFQVGTVLTAANDRLKPETLWGGELGAQVVLDELAFAATAFANRLRDPIANVTLAMPVDGAGRQRQNLGTSRVVGLDLDLTWRPSPAWTVRVAHAFSDGRVTSAPAQPELVGKRLAQDPHHRTVGALRYAHPRASATLQARYLGTQFEDDLNTQPIGAVVLFDARGELALTKHVAIFAAGENLFDRRYLVGRAGIDTEGAPRTLELGVAYR